MRVVCRRSVRRARIGGARRGRPSRPSRWPTTSGWCRRTGDCSNACSRFSRKTGCCARTAPAPDGRSSNRPATTRGCLYDALVSKWPSIEAELSVLARCARALPRVLRGQADPLQVLFPGGSMEPLKAYYAHTPGRTRAEHVGGGSRAVAVERAGPRRADSDYRGRRRNGQHDRTGVALSAARRHRLHVYGPLAVLHHPRHAQLPRRAASCACASSTWKSIRRGRALPAASFDIVIAANVLHATSNLRRSPPARARTPAPRWAAPAAGGGRPSAPRRPDLRVVDGVVEFHRRGAPPEASAALGPHSGWPLLDETGFRHAAAIPRYGAGPGGRVRFGGRSSRRRAEESA